MTRVLTVREYQTVKIGPLESLSDRDGDALSRLSGSLPSQSVTWVHRGIRFGSYCGVLQVGDLTIEILPKVGPFDAATDVARGVLVAMLRDVGLLGAPRLGSANLAQQSQHLLDIFILDFCERISGLLKQGPIRSFSTFEADLSAIRGRVQLVKQLRKTAGDRVEVACCFDERSIDNPFNQALKSVLRRLLDAALGPQVRSTLNALLIRFDEVSAYPCSIRDIEALPFDRLLTHWKPVFDQAALFLRALFPDVRAGQWDGASFLFDMERLFEAYVGVRLKRAWNGRGTDCSRIVLQGPQRYLAQSDNGPAFRMRPDAALITAEGDVQRVFDAKWKVLDPGGPNLGVTREDAYQLASYAGRYGCGRVVLIYPAWAGIAAGRLGSLHLELTHSPAIDVFAVDLASLAKGEDLPEGLGPDTRSLLTARSAAAARALFV